MLKKLLVCTILFYTWTNLSAQQLSQDDLANHGQKWTAGLNMSIDYCNRWLRDRDGSDFSQSYIRIFNDIEIAKPGYTIGVSFEIPFSDKSVINTGLLFANKGYQTKWSRNLHWPDTSQFNSITGVKSISTIYHLDIPIVFQTYLNPVTKKWFLSYGLATNIFLQENYTQVIEEDGQKHRTTRKETYEFNPINLSPEIGFGRQFKLDQSMSLQIAPVFRYGIFSTLKDNPVGTHLWSLGLKVVCYWRGEQ